MSHATAAAPHAHPLADRLLAAWNSGDVRRIAALYAEDAVVRHPLAPDVIRGRAAVQQLEGGLFSAFSEIDWRIESVVADGRQVAVEFRVTALNSAPLPSPQGMVPATGRRVDLRAASIVRLTDAGLIAEEHRYLDTATMFAQLGLR
jgi:steroid delta-isomerase-like uncharacterized protein